MHLYPYIVPEEAVWFVEHEFDRFQAPKPSPKALDKVIDYTLKRLVDCDYFHVSEEDMRNRYQKAGLIQSEMHLLYGPVELAIRMKERIMPHECSQNQLHLIVWATMMFSWSDKGAMAVHWYKTVGIKEKNYA